MDRRDFLVGSSAALVGLACGDDDGSDAGRMDAGTDAPPDELAWRDIPAIVLTVGLPADIDFRTYLDDPTGSATVSFDRAAPPGTAFEGSVLRGTPSAEEMGTFIATATDGTDDPRHVDLRVFARGEQHLDRGADRDQRHLER